MAVDITFHTKSGRLYEFDTNNRKFRRVGEQPFHDFRIQGGTTIPGDGGRWNSYDEVYLRPDGRVVIYEADDSYSMTTAVVEDDLASVQDWLYPDGAP